MPRLNFVNAKQGPPRGPNFSNIDWETINYKPNNILKQINKTYGKTDYAFSKDYIKQTHEELCNRRDFKLSPQQKFVSDFIRPENPSKGLLVYHGLGSGKTVTSIIAGEAMKPEHTGGGGLKGRSKTRVIIVVPVALLNTYKKEILGPGPEQVLINGIPQSYKIKKQVINLKKTLEKEINKYMTQLNKLEKGSKKYNDLTKLVKDKQKLLTREKKKEEEKINRSYEIISHQKFLNLLVKKTREDGTYDLGEMYERKGSNPNPMKMKRTLIIIDEVQRLISETGSSYKKLFYSLKYHSNPNLKLILLTGTPIYDKPFEAALTMNLLRPRIPFPNTKQKFEEMFVKFEKSGNLLPKPVGPKNEELFKYLCSGYVSYYSGGNPKSFPFKTMVNMQHRMRSSQQGKYKSILESELRKALKDKQNFSDEALDLFDDKAGENDDTREPMNVFILSQMYANIALPGVDDKVARYLEFKFNREAMDPFKTGMVPRELNKKAIVQEGLVELKQKVKESYSSGGLMEGLKTVSSYSEKYSYIAKLIIGTPGISFFFSNFLDYGVKAMANILEGLGFEEYKPGKPIRNQRAMKFVIWSSESAGGKEGEQFAQDVQAKFNSDENIEGEIIKVVLGTRSIMEGVSFRNVRQVHISDPWWNESRIEQIAARAVRTCSHSSLNEKDRNVIIYKHMSTYKNGNKGEQDIVDLLRDLNAGGELLRSFETGTIEEYMYARASSKMGLTQSFQNLLKESAIDCGINKYGNLERLVEMYEPVGDGKSYYLTYFDKRTDKRYVRDDVGLEKIRTDDVVRGVRGYTQNMAGENKFKFLELKISSKGKLKVDYGKVLKGLQNGLVLKEEVRCNDSKDKLSSMKGNVEVKNKLRNLYRNEKLTRNISNMINGRIFKNKLYNFVNSKYTKPKVLDATGKPVYKGSISELRKKVKRIIMKKAYLTPHERMVHDLIFKYGAYGTDDEDILLTMSDDFLRNKIKTEKEKI